MLEGKAAARAALAHSAQPAARSSAWSRLANSNAFIGYLFILPVIVGLVVFVAYPVTYSLYLSFTSGTFGGAARWLGGRNYGELLHDRLFWYALRNTAYYTFASILMEVPLALALALAMNQKLKGIVAFRFVLFLPVITSSVAIAVMWGWIYNPQFGILNQMLRVIGVKRIMWLAAPETAMLSIIIMSTWRGMGYTMLLFLAALQDIPEVYYEAAQVDGAGAWRRFRHITLPLISPMTFFLLVLGVIGGFQIFEYAYTLGGATGGPVYSTLTLVLYLYSQGFRSFRIGYASALAYIIFVIVLVMTLIQFRMQRRWVFYE